MTFVLGLPGMELTFFLAACVVLCFALVATAVLVAHQGFGYCWAALVQRRGFLSTPAPSKPRIQECAYAVHICQCCGGVTLILVWGIFVVDASEVRG